MKNNSFFLANKIILFVLLFVFNYTAFSQGQGQTPIHFKMGGNSTTNPSERLGLKNNSELHLITADTSRMEITNEGDVKIKKEVFLEKYLGQQNERRLIEITPDGKLQPLNGGSTALRTLIYAEPAPVLPCPALNSFWVSKDDFMYLQESCNGTFVGIGTYTPVQKLDVRGIGYFSDGIGIGIDNPHQKLHVHNGNILLTGSSSSLLFDNGGGTWGNWGIEYESNAGGLNFWKPSGSTGGFGNYFLFLKNNGNVGIGTDNPQAKLHVKVDNDSDKAFAAYKGTTEQFLITGDGRFYGRAYRIKMGNFPDYVFEDSYKRMSSQEKSEYFNKNKRLPYMPSAKEIESEGLDVGDGLIGITRNTEENSLDIIELHEKNKTLEKAGQDMDEKIKKLEKEIEALKILLNK